MARLERERLARAEADAAAQAAHRRPVPVRLGLNDYRCVMHAHSDLSHDSRGTSAEIAAAAREAGVEAVFLTNHPQDRLDVVERGPRGRIGGVLFVPGAETRGFLAFPGDGRLPGPGLSDREFAQAVRRSGGLVFAAHPEERADWDVPALNGMEVYNTHADFQEEAELLKGLRPRDSQGWARLFGLLEAFRLHPQAAFAALADRPAENLRRYDLQCAVGPFTAVAANDSHQNTGFVVRGGADGRLVVEDPLGERLGELDPAHTPAARLLFGEPAPGREALRRVLDPYVVSFRHVSTHVLADAAAERSLRRALALGRTYVAFDWMGDPSGTVFRAFRGRESHPPGARVRGGGGLRLQAALPLPARVRILRDGAVVEEREAALVEAPGDSPGVYRMEADLRIGGEWRPWILTGAIRVATPRPAASHRPRGGSTTVSTTSARVRLTTSSGL